MSGKSLAWAGEGCRCVPARDRVCHGVLSAACCLAAAVLQLCAGWQVGVWRRGEHVPRYCTWEACPQVILVIEMEEIIISSPTGRRALNFLYFLYFFLRLWRDFCLKISIQTGGVSLKKIVTLLSLCL